ncbi:MAG: IS66 family transposase [Myxococcota bacterium]
MVDVAEKLPDTVAALRALVLERDVELEARDAEIAQLREYVRLLRHQRFGTKSEKVHPDQLLIFNEAEQELAEAVAKAKDADEIPVPAHTRRKGGRRPLPESLPCIEVVHDLPEEEKVCTRDGSRLVEIGRERSEQLEIIPAKLRRVRHIRPKYACPTCKQGVKVAPVPPQPIPKSIASPALLAHVATSKFVDGMPLYRQEVALKRIGVELPRSTLASWMVKVGRLAQPLINLLHEEILATGFVQADETRFQVLKEPGRKATSLSYLWVLRAGGRARPAVVYHYDPSREGEVAEQLLEGFQGYLQSDGYSGYDAIGAKQGIVHVGCFAHARRKFHEALKAQGGGQKAKRGKGSRARQGFDRIRALYLVERELRDATPQERYPARLERSKPILDEMRGWLDDSLGTVPPQSLTGKALTYLDNQWPKLERVLEDGRLPLDTNDVENAIRPFVVGRKAWLFADTVAGAEASANLYSLVETAKANGIEPFAYLRFLFERIPAAEHLEDFEALLPYRIDRSLLAAG